MVNGARGAVDVQAKSRSVSAAMKDFTRGGYDGRSGSGSVRFYGRRFGLGRLTLLNQAAKPDVTAGR
jgi:hypothetical protein